MKGFYRAIEQDQELIRQTNTVANVNAGSLVIQYIQRVNGKLRKHRHFELHSLIAPSPCIDRLDIIPSSTILKCHEDYDGELNDLQIYTVLVLRHCFEAFGLGGKNEITLFWLQFTKLRFLESKLPSKKKQNQNASTFLIVHWIGSGPITHEEVYIQHDLYID